MSNERESLPATPIDNDSNLPAVVLTYTDYDIGGNVFRAYYDNAGHMVFVVDHTQNLRKPNVLLVLPADGARKWDDILVTDWGVNLETIRPRKDNKYQKLDVEYGNVDAYKRLVHDFQVGVDLQSALDELNTFRDNAVRQNALARLDGAQDTADRARETIEKTNDSIKELNVRIKELRAKLAAQKKSIGKEPTKQSAAKILRSDSQIEATGEKIDRARRRLANARRRLVVAEDDIAAAQNILDILDSDDNSSVTARSVMVAPNTEMIVSPEFNVPNVPEFKEIITEPKAEEMAEEEVKPLFDKDPEILDEEIAFKPIDFGVSAVTTPSANTDASVVQNETTAPAPLSFTPPRDTEYDNAPVAPQGDFAPIPDVPDVPSSPVLDSMRPVEQSHGTSEYDVRPAMAAPQEPAFAAAAADAPIVQPSPYDNLSTNNYAPASSVPEYNNSLNTAGAQNVRPSVPMPGVADASASSGFRPVSPIRGASVTPVAPVQRKSKLVYYLMLVILIALSIFTLWIYQRSTSQNIPELTTTTATPAADSDTDIAQSATSSPFIGGETEKVEPVADTPEPEPVAPVVATEPVVTDVVAPEPQTVQPVMPEPVAAEPEPVVVEPEPVVIEPEPQPAPVDETADVAVTTVEAESPFLTEPVEKPKIEPIKISIDPIVNKPEYNVSQQEKMFVADPEYETDTPVDNNQNVVYPDEAPVSDSDGAVCSDGALPDANGCCGGEVFTDMENGTFACCQPVEGGECFAPMR